MIFLFLSSGLFLGWSLGANDAANVFGTAVGTKMLKFRTAAIIASIFLILGAVLEGSGASQTLGQLGAVNTLAGAFTVALSAGFTVTVMTRLRIPVSTSQAVVGAIIGWNIFSGSPTDPGSLSKIVFSWVLSPILAALFAIILYFITKRFIENSKIHLISMDVYTRLALILVGAFGAYSLGANNIANVMGVFVPSSPFKEISVGGIFHLSSIQQLFLIGGIAIAIGVFTYSYRVMNTVGRDLFRLSPVTAFIVVLSHSIVLYLFASQTLRDWLLTRNLPAFPLVPVSSSQAVIGAIIGIAIAKGGRNLQWSVLGRISSGWITTPLIACLFSFVALFFVQNVFDQQVYHETVYTFPDRVIEQLEQENIEQNTLEYLSGMEFGNIRRIRRYLNSLGVLDENEVTTILYYSAEKSLEISKVHLRQLNSDVLTPDQIQAVNSLRGKSYRYPWELYNDLSTLTDEWQYRPETLENVEFNNELQKRYDYVINLFEIHRR